MKHLLIATMLVSQFAWADCSVKTASINQTQQQVGPVRNLEKRVTYGRCEVTFNLTVNGETHNLQGEWIGPEIEEALCRKAIENTRKQFLLTMGGDFKTEAVTVCKEGQGEIVDKVKKGDVILENEVGDSPIKKYFSHNGAKCRMFQEHGVVNGKMRTYNGVICQIDKSETNWLVIEKF
jgi:hypothetical protein